MCLCSGVCVCGGGVLWGHRVCARACVSSGCLCRCVCGADVRERGAQWVCLRGECVLRRRRVCERQVDIRVCVRACGCVCCVAVVATWLSWLRTVDGGTRRVVWPGVRGRRQYVSGCAGGVECGRQQRAAAHGLCVGVGVVVVVVAGCDGPVWEAVWAAGAVWRRVEAGLCEGVRSVKSQLSGCVVGMLVGMVYCV